MYGASLLIFANKSDIKDALNADQIAELLDFDGLKNRHCGIISCSAIKGIGLKEGIDWIINDIKKRIFVFD